MHSLTVEAAAAVVDEVIDDHQIVEESDASNDATWLDGLPVLDPETSLEVLADGGGL